MVQASEQDFSGGTILVVEDSEAIRKMVCAMLTQSGFHCLEAADGEEALRLLDGADGVGLVLTDIVMPNMSGADLARHLSRTHPELRIVFMSGYTDDPLVRSLERTSAVFLSKPFTAKALTEKVQQALTLPWGGLPDPQMGSKPA